MEKLIIKGGTPLEGEVTVSGAKNAALPIMASSLMVEGEHVLRGVPHLMDIKTMSRLLEHIGSHVEWDGALKIKTREFNADEAPYDLVKTMRASVLVLGPLVGQLKHAKISLPGGCAIGARPIDLHLKALETMGARIELNEGYVEVFAPKLHGAEISFDKVTVTGTENIIMAAVLAEGKTVITNAAREPEIADLADHLVNMGADIRGAGTDRIEIEGVNKLHPAEHDIIPDRIEAGTLLMAAGITGGRLKIDNFPTEMLKACVKKLREAGLDIETDATTAFVKPGGKLTGTNMTTAPHPGFATDLQAQFMALMSIADGTSIITETIFENRFMHVPELVRMGADINVDGGISVIKGKKNLKGAPVMATDLRASASLVIAALAAEGTSDIRRIYHLDRGYEAIEKKLCAVGADIVRTNDDA